MTDTPIPPDDMTAINERVAWIGRATDDPALIEGAHADHILMIIDEGKSVNEGFHAGAAWAFVQFKQVDEAMIERAATALHELPESAISLERAEVALRAALEVGDD